MEMDSKNKSFRKKFTSEEFMKAMDELCEGKSYPNIIKELQRSRREDWTCACKGD